MSMLFPGRYLTIKFALLIAFGPITTWSAEEPLPYYLKDRGEGVTTSLFGTYIKKDELLVYPFYEYIKSNKEEYHGSELNGVGEIDYEGKLEEHEFGLFIAYGFTDDLAVELEAILYGDVTLDKALNDTTSGIPNRIQESGFGAVETNIRWRLRRETKDLAEIYVNFEVEYPLQKGKILLGASDWEFSTGIGRVKGYSWGTITSRISIVYDRGEEEMKLGEYAVEYLKKVDDSFRWVSTLEGEDADISLIFETQWHINKNSYWKIGSGFGVTGQAEAFSPEIGLMFSF